MTRALAEGITLRTVSTEADIERSSHMLASALAPEEYQRIYRLSRDGLRECPHMRKERSFLAELQGRVVARLQLIDVSLQIGDTLVPAVGMSGLVIEPEFQGVGIVLRFEDQVIGRVRDEGAEVVLGYTGLRRYYERLGGVTVMPDYELTFHLPAREGEAGNLREATADDLPALLRMYRETNVGRTGVLSRTLDRWPWLYRRSDSYLIGPSGYAGLRSEGDEVFVDEVGGDHGFFEALIRRLAPRRTGARVKIVANIPPDHPFARLVNQFEPAFKMELRSSGGCMARILSLERLLRRLEPQIASRYEEIRSGAKGLRLTFKTPESDEASCLLGHDLADERAEIVELSRPAIARLLFGTLPPGQVLDEAAFRGSKEIASLLGDLFPQTFPHTWRADKF